MKKEKSNTAKLELHFKYTVVILLLVSCIVGGLALYNQNMAVKGLSNASLLLSIVLAIIAILITLWDVAGQRQNVYDMKKEIEKLNTIVEKSSSFSHELDAGLSKIEARYKENTDLLYSLHKLVEDSKLMDKNPEEFYKKAIDLFNKNIILNNNEYNNLKNQKEYRKASSDITRYVYKNPGVTSDEVLGHFTKEHPSFIFFYKTAIDDLIFREELKRDSNGGLTSDLPF